MPRTFSEIEQDAMQLSETERGVLVDRLVASLGDGEMSPEIEAAWIEVAEKRLADLRSGRVIGIPGDEVMAELQDLSSARNEKTHQPGYWADRID